MWEWTNSAEYRQHRQYKEETDEPDPNTAAVPPVTGEPRRQRPAVHLKSQPPWGRGKPGNKQEKARRFGVARSEWKELLRRRPNPEGGNTLTVFLAGAVLTPITFIGALLGYVRGYNRFMLPYGEHPKLGPLNAPMRAAMIAARIGADLGRAVSAGSAGGVAVRCGGAYLQLSRL